jgi:hypothetical protein
MRSIVAPSGTDTSGSSSTKAHTFRSPLPADRIAPATDVFVIPPADTGGMCEICNGASRDDVLEGMHQRIQEYGFTTIAVEEDPPWVYTIGLARVGHPELVVAGTHIAFAYSLLQMLGGRVMHGEQFGVDSVTDVGGLLCSLGPVHPTRLASGLCGMWSEYDDAHPGMGRLEVLQVQIPDDRFCRCHAGAQPRLELPGAEAGSPRRERRRAQAARRRSSRR